jgi:hypothetical protein
MDGHGEFGRGGVLMARQSEHLGLTLPEVTDFVPETTERYAQNFEIIDAAISAIEEMIEHAPSPYKKAWLGDGYLGDMFLSQEV